MSVIKDILGVVNKDREHFVRFVFDNLGFTTYLIYDPECNFEEDIVIPIQYDVTFDAICIPNEDYRKRFNPNEGGIEHSEIKLIDQIMNCMEVNIEEIKNICSRCHINERKNYAGGDD